MTSTLTLELLKEKIDRLYKWYSTGTHGCSERFNDGRLSALAELQDWIRLFGAEDSSENRKS